MTTEMLTAETIPIAAWVGGFFWGGQEEQYRLIIKVLNQRTSEEENNSIKHGDNWQFSKATFFPPRKKTLKDYF